MSRRPKNRSRRAGGKLGVNRSKNALTGPAGEFVQLVIDYAKQETLGPLKGLGRFVAFGMIGSVFAAAGLLVLLLAGLRALQTETGSTFAGSTNWIPYVIIAFAAILLAGLTASRITRGAARRKEAR